MIDFTHEQPRDGDTVAHCGHIGAHTAGSMHFFEHVPFRTVTRPDGTTVVIKWTIACDACYRLAGGDCHRIAIRGDAQWVGDEPAIRKPIGH